MSKLNDLAKANQELLLWILMYAIGLAILVSMIYVISHRCQCEEPVSRRSPLQFAANIERQRTRSR